MTTEHVTSRSSRRRAVLPAALALAAGTAALLVPAAVAGPAAVVSHTGLSDLRPTVADPTDGATAHVTSVRAGGETHTVLALHGLDRSVAGTTYGAHVHVGPCVAGDGAAALGHFNIDVFDHAHEVEVSPYTEVWLDFTVTRGGTGHAVAHVPFEVPEGAAASVVVHAQPTAPDGSAGPRIACLPVEL
jgi:Cu/Zn superoxide dismutase